MKKLLLSFLVLCSLCVSRQALAQIQFQSYNQLTPVATHSGNCVTVVDVNNDGLDDIVKMDQSETLVIELQQADGSYVHYNLGSITGGGNVWGMAVADVDHNGWKDVATGTGSTCYLVKLAWNGSTITAATTTLAESYFVQNITFGDFNGDGWVDLFVCDDVDFPKIYMNDGAGNLPILARSDDTRLIGIGPYTFNTATGLSFTAGQTVFIGYNAANNMYGTVTAYNSATGQLDVNITNATGAGSYSGWSIHNNMILNSEINPGLTVGGDPYDSGNYGSVWTDFDNDGDLDLYIAHCRQSATSFIDQRRRDRLFVNNGNNFFTEDLESYGLEPGITSVTGSVSGTTLTVTAMIAGTLHIGQHIYGTGISNAPTITAFQTGTGGIGTYTISSTQNANSTTISAGDFRQTWTTSFGDIDNDGDLDIVMTNHSSQNGQILLNDGTGHYTDVTASTGFDTEVFGGMDPLESITEDFDNDGFIDILVTGGGSGQSYVFYRNNGNGTFSLVNSPFPVQGNGMLSFATGDLNHDGKTDIFASYGNVYNTPTTFDDQVYLNSTPTQNHFIGFELTGTASNHGAIGARVTIYGPWGIQIREVRAGESYGTSNSFQLHFGLGMATSVDSARINWPSGQQTHFGTLAADQFVTAVEGGCTITGNIIPGPHAFCTGQTLTLNAAPGFSSYLWSTGAATTSISLTASDTVSVTVTDGSGCVNVSPAVYAVLNPDETPQVTASTPEVNLCQGETVTLTSSPAASYLWSNGDVTQSTIITQSGTYSVTTQGTCTTWVSTARTLNFFPAPSPSTTGANLLAPGSAQLTATGNNVYWFSTASGGTPLDSGLIYNTGFLNQDTVFYAEDRFSYPGPVDSTGIMYSTASTYSGNTTNAMMLFDVMKPCILRTVKVYTDSAGTRLIELRDNANNVIQSALVTVPVDSTVITLNFNIPPGTGYRLTTNTNQNMTSFGYASPRFRRNSAGVTYPYTINGLLSITGSDQGATRYYYFYDWVVEPAPKICISQRTPTYVTVVVGIQELSSLAGVRAYPNPTDALLNFSFAAEQAKPVTIRITDLAGRLVSSERFEHIAVGQVLPVDASTFAAGSYLYTVDNGEGTASGRFSVMK